MTFRDDHDAAIARADALETEVERTKRERDELAAKVKQLEQENAEHEHRRSREDKQRVRAEKRANKERKPRASSPAPSAEATQDKRVGIGIGVVCVLIVAAFAAFGIRQSCNHRSEVGAWEAKRDARESHRARWNAVISIEPCLRRAAWDNASARRYTPDQVDPRKTAVYSPAPGANCLDGAKQLVADPKTTPAIKAALGAWIDLQRELEAPAKALDAYYSNRDWQEDNFAGATALWQPVLRIADREIQLFEVIRRDVLPALRDETRGVIKMHEAATGRDELYWRAALQVQLWEINDRTYAASGLYAGKQPDNPAAVQAVRAQVSQFLELVKQAPIEVRREIRKLDWITSQIITGGDLKGETPLWHLADADDDLLSRGRDAIPALPPDPGPRPADLD
jgi:hypothetical protein